MAIFFVSDVHLSPERAQVTSAFYEFLSSHARKATDFFILGDLFETWIGDDELILTHCEQRSSWEG